MPKSAQENQINSSDLKAEFTERLIRLDLATRLSWMPRRSNGRPFHVATLTRWALRGVKGIRLQTVKAGRTRYTTEQKLNTFFEALAEADMQPASSVPRPATTKVRELAAIQAHRILNPREPAAVTQQPAAGRCHENT